MDFDFYAIGIEDAIIALLKQQMPEAKMIETYSGQLDDAASLKEAIASKGRKFPLIMVSYADGEDVPSPPTSGVLGRSLHFRHDCTFVVICVSNNARGDEQRRRGPNGCYSLLAQVRKHLTGLRFTKSVEGEKHLLTSQPLKPLSNEYVARMPSMTAYAVPFTTSFNWSSPDRTATGIDVSELVVGVDNNLNSAISQPGQNLPGVTYEV